MRIFKLLPLLALLLVFGCDENEFVADSNVQMSDLESKLVPIDLEPVSFRSTDGDIRQWAEGINSALAEYGIQLEKAEYLGADQAGNVVFFNDRGNKQLSSDYVPFDPRNGTGDAVPYVIDGTEATTSSGMDAAAVIGAYDSAMATWDAATCSQGLTIPRAGVAPFDVGYVQFLLGFGGVPGFFPGTIVQAGILPPAFFDLLAPGGGNGILGVCFTFTWLEEINGDGKGDVAIKEIYYNDGFNWQDAPDDVLGNGIYDLETVVLHEVGHGLSQAHFGKAFGTPSNGKIHFAPYALMNAGYTIGNRNVAKTDLAGHCSNWGDWPNN